MILTFLFENKKETKKKILKKGKRVEKRGEKRRNVNNWHSQLISYQLWGVLYSRG